MGSFFTKISLSLTSFRKTNSKSQLQLNIREILYFLYHIISHIYLDPVNQIYLAPGAWVLSSDNPGSNLRSYSLEGRPWWEQESFCYQAITN